MKLPIIENKGPLWRLSSSQYWIGGVENKLDIIYKLLNLIVNELNKRKSD